MARFKSDRQRRAAFAHMHRHVRKLKRSKSKGRITHTSFDKIDFKSAENFREIMKDNHFRESATVKKFTVPIDNEGHTASGHSVTHIFRGNGVTLKTHKNPLNVQQNGYAHYASLSGSPGAVRKFKNYMNKGKRWEYDDEGKNYM